MSSFGFDRVSSDSVESSYGVDLSSSDAMELSHGVHFFPRIPIDISSADQSELSIVRETLVVLFLRHPHQSAMRFMVMLDTEGYYIDWSDCVIIGSEEVPVLLQACGEAWPGGDWTFKKGDTTMLLAGADVDEAKTGRASFLYTAWPTVLDMDYIASVRPICKTKTQCVSSDYVDLVLASWCIGRDIVSFPTLNILEETCSSPRYQRALCNYLQTVRVLMTAGGTRYVVINFNVASATATFKKKIKNRKRAVDMIDSEYGKQMQGNANKGAFAYHTMIMLVDNDKNTVQLLHGMASHYYQPSTTAMTSVMGSAFPDYLYKQMPERRLVTGGLYPFQDKYWTNCGPVACALVYLVVVADIDIKSICAVPNRVIRELYSAMITITNQSLAMFVCTEEKGRYAVMDDLRSSLSMMNMLPAISDCLDMSVHMRSQEVIVKFHDNIEDLITAEKK